MTAMSTSLNQRNSVEAKVL